MIELRDVALDAGQRPLLRGASARFSPGEFVALLGPNGVGKTTLLRTIAGLRPPAGGHVILDSVDITRCTVLDRALRVALVTSDDVLPDALLVRDVVAIGRFAHHRWWQWRERPDDAAAIASALWAVGADDLTLRAFATLSSGERQRVWIALGLAQATPVLLLDEPTSHLDVRVAHDILSLLRRLARAGKTIVCVLHDLNDAAAYADTIALLSDRRLLCAAPPDEVLRSHLLEQAYGVDMQRVRLEDGTLRIVYRASQDAGDCETRENYAPGSPQRPERK